ncbi:NlpC/P60 family protein [Streptomyces sp. NPDC046909]|uniref:C40 family peptidase n=1 Tax=Streptomyces sp. NPDC046909 TaxID=3155617 RepID=UPI0033C3204E
MVDGAEEPSRDEVRRRIDRLYDRAESDTGTFNATRAAAIPRQRGTADRARSQAPMAPDVGALARQWFDTARAKLGPTVPVSQPERRTPDRGDRPDRPERPERESRAARPAPAMERPAEPLALEAPKAARASTGGALELTSGPAQAPTMEFVPEPTEIVPTIPEPTAVAYLSDVPAGGVDTYGAGPETGSAALYDPYLPADPYLSAEPAAFYTDTPPAGSITATYGAGLESVAAVALTAAPAAPVADPLAFTAPIAEPAAPAAPPTMAAAPPATYSESWPPAAVSHTPQAERVIAFARAQIGRPCVWGAVGPESYDAAGLTQAAWKAAGVTLPRTAQAQAGVGVQVSLADVRVGDLVFFHDDLSHVGIWSGDGMMIHAPGPGAAIREESVFFAGQFAIKGAVRPA